MAIFLRQSTAATVKIGPFVDSTDGSTAEDGLTIQKADVRLSKNGGNMAAASADQGALDAGAAHDELGYYDISLDTTDTGTLGSLKVMITEPGALPVWADFQIVTANVWDSLFSTDVLQVHAVEITDGLITAAAIATGAIDADAIAADAIGSSELAATAVNEIADQVWDEIITAGQHNTKNSAATFLRKGGGGTQVTLYSGTAASGTATTIVLDNGASSTNDIYNRNIIALVSGTGAGQTRKIVDYVGASRTVYVDSPWVVTPDATTGFEIIAAPTSFVSDEGVAQGGGNDYIDLATTASDQDDAYNNSLVTITSGTGAGQTEVITDYTGATRRASIAAETWSVNPDSSSVYAVIPSGNYASDTSTTTAPTAAEVADAVWDELKAEHAVADTFGDYLDDEITSRAVAGDAMTLADDAITASKFDQSTAHPLASADTGATAVARTGADADTLETLSDQLDTAQIDLDNPGQYKADVSALALQASVDDLEGRLTAVRAGYLDNLSVGAVALEATAQTILDDTGTAGVLVAAGSKTGYALTAGERNSIADALLKRDWTGITGEAARSLVNALRFLRNKWSVSGTTLTVTKEDDATEAWTAELSTTAGADPVTGSDPA